jgi:hypothetical protein
LRFSVEFGCERELFVKEGAAQFEGIAIHPV